MLWRRCSEELNVYRVEDTSLLVTSMPVVTGSSATTFNRSYGKISEFTSISTPSIRSSPAFSEGELGTTAGDPLDIADLSAKQIFHER